MGRKKSATDDENTDSEAPDAQPTEVVEPSADDGGALEPSKQLLSDIVEQAISSGIHTAASFIDRFPPDALMEELRDAPELRAKILVACVKFPQRTAELLDPKIAGPALHTALSAKDTSAVEVMDNFSPDDRVRYLPNAALWAFVDGDAWWKNKDDNTASFMRFVLERTQTLGLMDTDAWRDGIGVPFLAKRLSRKLLEKLFERAAKLGSGSEPFSSTEIFELATVSDLVDAIGTEHLHDNVVIPLARRCNFTISRSAGADGPAKKRSDLGWTVPPSTAKVRPPADDDESAVS